MTIWGREVMHVHDESQRPVGRSGELGGEHADG